MGPEFGPVFGASEYWHISRGLRKRSHFGACILVLASHFRAHFWNRTIWTRSDHFFSNMRRRTPKCSQLMLALNTYSFQTNKLKLAAFLPSAAPTGEAPCSAHVFEGFFGLENGPVKSDKSQEKTLFGKEMPEDASRHPKPTSYPQTRQDTVVGVFPIHPSESATRRLCGLFSASPHPRRILTKMFEAICCMNMRFAKRSWEHPCF